MAGRKRSGQGALEALSADCKPDGDRPYTASARSKLVDVPAAAKGLGKQRRMTQVFGHLPLLQETWKQLLDTE